MRLTASVLLRSRKYIPSYPHIAGSRREGTSANAAESIDAGTLRKAVLAELEKDGPMTPDECAGKLRLSVLSIRPRFTELKRLGSVIETGNRRLNRSGRYAEVCAMAGQRMGLSGTINGGGGRKGVCG